MKIKRKCKAKKCRKTVVSHKSRPVLYCSNVCRSSDSYIECLTGECTTIIYSPPSFSKVHCSKECRQRHLHNKNSRVCKLDKCNESFRASPSEKKLYCSKECREDSYGPPEQVCDSTECETTYLAYSGTKKYCSKECVDANRPPPSNKGVSKYPHDVESRCKGCGDNFTTTLDYPSTKVRAFCSRSCSDVSNSKWKEWEIIHLAYINPGVGFVKFANKLYSSSTVYGGATHFEGIFGVVKEVDGVDLFDHLQKRPPKRRDRYQRLVKNSLDIEFNWGELKGDPRIREEMEK